VHFRVMFEEYYDPHASKGWHGSDKASVSYFSRISWRFGNQAILYLESIFFLMNFKTFYVRLSNSLLGVWMIR